MGFPHFSEIMDIEQPEAKLEAVESRISKVDLLLERRLWTDEEKEQFGDHATLREDRKDLREDKRQLREERLIVLRQQTGILSVSYINHAYRNIYTGK